MRRWRIKLDFLEKSYQTNLINQNIFTHPFIIFYDDIFDDVYYLSLKGYKSKYNDLIKDNKYILIHPDPNNQYQVLNKPSVLDTTTIYRVSKKEFQKEFNVSDSDIENWFQHVDIDLQQEILMQLIKNIDNNHIAYKELLKIREFDSTNIDSISDTKYASNSWIKQELSNELQFKNPTLLQQHLNTVDNNDNKFNLHHFTNKPTNLVKSLGWLKVLIVRVVNDWIDTNKIDVNHKNFIDIDHYNLKWSSFKQKVK